MVKRIGQYHRIPVQGGWEGRRMAGWQLGVSGGIELFIWGITYQEFIIEPFGRSDLFISAFPCIDRNSAASSTPDSPEERGAVYFHIGDVRHRYVLYHFSPHARLIQEQGRGATSPVQHGNVVSVLHLQPRDHLL